MEKKYIIVPGTTRSINGGPEKKMTAQQLADAYGVDLKECYVVEAQDEREVLRNLPRLPHLRPRSEGDYNLARAIAKGSSRARGVS